MFKALTNMLCGHPMQPMPNWHINFEIAFKIDLIYFYEIIYFRVVLTVYFDKALAT